MDPLKSSVNFLNVNDVIGCNTKRDKFHEERKKNLQVNLLSIFVNEKNELA